MPDTTRGLCGLLLLALAASLGAQGRGERDDSRRRAVSEQLETVKVRLVSIASQYQELERQRNDNVQQARTLEEDLVTVNLKHTRAVQSLERIRLELRQAEAAHQEHLERFTRGLAHFYKLKNRPFLALVINSKDLSEFSRRYKVLQYVFQQDYKELEKLQRTRKDLAAKQQALEAASKELEDTRGQKEQTGRDLSATIVRGQEILESLAKEKKRALERASQLQDSLAYIDSKMRQITREPAGRLPPPEPEPEPSGPVVIAPPPELPESSPGGAGSLRPGRIAWPIDTRQEIQIVRTYGQSRSETGSLYFNPGIDISINRPQQVRAIAAGKVMHRGNMPNFGKVVFLDHGGSPDKIISIYGNLDDILVPVGQDVVRGQAIGTVGNDGPAARDTTLHFEIRQNASHQDPLRWLQGGRQMLGRNR